MATEPFLLNEEPSRGPGMPECYVVSDSYRPEVEAEELHVLGPHISPNFAPFSPSFVRLPSSASHRPPPIVRLPSSASHPRPAAV
uniref:Uncharacterized protein n=1 Tax=Knipowitschia caucasica TaxID=637954 RepID=A0AAV2KKN0_KNICA